MAMERSHLTDLIVGTLIMVVSLICAISYSIILAAIYKDKDLIKLPSYRFMFFLGIFDVVQCIPHFVTGLFTIFQTTGFPLLPKILGVLATPSYVGYTVMTVVLAVNRFAQFTSIRMFQGLNLFKGKIIRVWYVLSLSVWLFFVLALSSPWASIEYIPARYEWSYNYSLSHSSVVQTIEMFIELGTIFVSAFFYCLIICYHKMQVTCKDYNVEVRVLVQAIVITIYCTVLNFLWHNSKALLPNSLWTDALLNFMWIFNSGVYPIIYVVVNRAIRDSIRSVSVVVVSVS